jgi:membrane associated rhomboid family serine protease
MRSERKTETGLPLLDIVTDAYTPSSQFSAFPPVIKGLLIANLLVFLAMLVPPTAELIYGWFALWAYGVRPGMQPGAFMPWQLVTYGFLHGGFGHLFFNMFALWMFGVPIERAWGSKRFSWYYFICLVGAGLTQLVVITLQGTPYPTVGASGAVLGVLLAFGMMYPDVPIYLYFFVPIKAKYLVILYALLDLFGGFSGAATGVAHFAHLGGMVTGFIVLQVWRRTYARRRERLYGG